ncbi:hypothetical protein [Sorangium sp. So ce145]|uniref:hypothetical protein n=1 Tax=Sorangium sp. So ce145 TaxID=3133285 RepID=UPI003F61D766
MAASGWTGGVLASFHHEANSAPRRRRTSTSLTARPHREHGKATRGEHALDLLKSAGRTRESVLEEIDLAIDGWLKERVRALRPKTP